MGKAGLFLLGLAWFAASTYVGYRLADRSFAWLDDLELKLPTGLPTSIPAIDVEAITSKLPTQGQSPSQWYAELPPEAKSCLQESIAPARIQAALRGELTEPTASEALAIALCLK
jgi:hypothetical protein